MEKTAGNWPGRRRGRIIRVRVDEILTDKGDPRCAQDAAFNALAASIARHGLLQPVVIFREKGRFFLICGKRRLAACRMLGLREIDAVLLDVHRPQAVACRLEEHATYAAPNVIEEARALRAAGMEAVGAHWALERTMLVRHVRLLALPECVQRVISERRLSQLQAEQLLEIADGDSQLEAALIIAERSLSPAQARRLVHGPKGNTEKGSGGRRRAVRQALETVTRMAQDMRLRGIDAAVSVHSQSGGMCVQIVFAHGENHGGQQDFEKKPRNT